MANSYDVIVVGAGNAALSAAMAAKENCDSVLVVEKAPEFFRGGNTYFTGGIIRFAFDDLEDIKQVIPDMSPTEQAGVEVGSYTENQFYDDMMRVTQGMSDPDLAQILVSQSFPTMKWLTEKGVRFVLSYGRQAFKDGDKYRFWGGLLVEAVGAGKGLSDQQFDACQKAGIDVRYSTQGVKLLQNDKGEISGLRVQGPDGFEDVPSKAVILAAGGFEANAEMRCRYLGPGWEMVKVRGIPYNTGDGIRMALDIGAMPTGNWSGCHAVGWDRNAPPFGDLAVGDGFQKHSYPLGIMVNATGKRFVDEGADFRNYTYAKYGHVVLQQPGQFAWQVFDAKVTDLLRDEYRIRQVTKASADTIGELAAKLDDVDAGAFVAEVEAYNAAVMTEVPFDPAVLDGRGTKGLEVPKSNWAQTLDTPPFEAFAITCGITFTFGGLKVTTEGHVIDNDGMPIPGLYAAGELVGGLFYFNYPGGTGLMSGAVFGRAAGTSATRAATG